MLLDKLCSRFFLLLLIVLPAILSLASVGGGVNPLVVNAADQVDDEELDEDGQVENDEPEDIGQNTVVAQESDDDEEEKPLKASPDADTTILFTTPTNPHELPAGKVVDFLVGFNNKGKKDFFVETMDASFRYPMDFSFYIQNFSLIPYQRSVKPGQQITLGYSFLPSETFASRPFGLTVNLYYKDVDGNPFVDAVFNETINVIELDEGLDGETFFLYVFLIACVVLLLVVGQQFLASFSKKKVVSKPVIETGTSNPNDVDYDWLPKETLNEIHKSPKRSPRTSPRQRRAKRATGADE